MTRLLDILIASVALVLASPLLLVATIAIRLETPGSPIYRQRRVGRDRERVAGERADDVVALADPGQQYRYALGFHPPVSPL